MDKTDAVKDSKGLGICVRVVLRKFALAKCDSEALVLTQVRSTLTLFLAAPYIAQSIHYFERPVDINGNDSYVVRAGTARIS